MHQDCHTPGHSLQQLHTHNAKRLTGIKWSLGGSKRELGEGRTSELHSQDGMCCAVILPGAVGIVSAEVSSDKALFDHKVLMSGDNNQTACIGVIYHSRHKLHSFTKANIGNPHTPWTLSVWPYWCKPKP